MKKSILLFLVALAINSVGQDLEQGLVAFYPFNGNANDESINSNHGLVQGAMLTTDRFGSEHSAFLFDGAEYISVSDHPTLRVQSLTLSAWVKLTETNGLQLIIDKHLGSGSLDSYEMWRQGGDIWGLIGNDSGFGPYIGTTTVIDTAKWIHLVYSFDDDSDTQKIYIDGELFETNTVTDTPSYDEEPLFIGASNDGQNPSYFFKGGIDDVRIYDRAISEAEVEMLCELSDVNVNEETVSGITVFPNPTSGSTKLALNRSAKIGIYDLNGILINQLIHQPGRLTDIQLPEQGVYIIRVLTNEGASETFRITKI